MENEYEDVEQCFNKTNQPNSSEDDIQEIIMQAQRAFAKKDSHRSDEKSEMTTIEDQNQDNVKRVAHQYAVISGRDLKTQKSSGREKSPKPVFSDDQQLTRRSNNQSDHQKNKYKQQRSQRTNVIDGDRNSEGFYIDTNLEKEVLSVEQERKYIPEPFKEIMREDMENLSSTRKNFKVPNTKQTEFQLLPKMTDKTMSHHSSFEKMTSHFSTKLNQNGKEIMDDDQFNMQNANFNMGGNSTRGKSSKVTSARQSLYPSVVRDMSPMQQYRKRIFKKDAKGSDYNTRKGSFSPNSENLTKYQELKKYHGRNNSKNSSTTRFSTNFGQLIDKITDVYPGFSKVAQSMDLNPQLEPDDLLKAENVFNQLRFMYQRVIEVKQENSHNDDQNASLKFTVDNAERELLYYQNQINVFKNQLQTAAMREQQTEINYEKRLEYLNVQIGQYENQIDHLQIKLDSNQNERELSFRETRNEKLFIKNGIASYTFDNVNNTPTRGHLDIDNKVSELTFECKDLKTKLKNQEEKCGFEKDTNQVLMDKIDKMNEAFKNEIQTCKKESTHLKAQIMDKQNFVKKLENKIEEISHCASLEFPIVISKSDSLPGQTPIKSPLPVILNPNVPRFINMKKQTKSPFLEEIEMDLDDIMNNKPFGDQSQDEIQLSTLGNVRKPVKKQSGQRQNKNQTLQKQTQNSAVQQMFSLSDAFKQQMSAVLIADDILKNMKISKAEQMKKIDNTLQINSKFNDKVTQFEMEKSQMGEKLQELTKDNENLKLKFSQLLDQFQEYVNESERKNEEEQMNHKTEQEKLLGQLNQSIKELDDLSKSLQVDVAEKQRQIDELYKERDQLIEQLKEADDNRNVAKSTDEVHKVQIKSLNEEIKYIKQQYLMEVEQLRNENINLHAQSAKVRDHERSQEVQNANQRYGQRSSSPYDMNEDQQINNKYEDSMIEHGCNEYNQDSQKLVRNKSHHQMTYNNTGHRNPSRENKFRGDQELQDCLCDANQYRSKSQDRIVGGMHDQRGTFDMHQSQVYEEKKREMLDKDRLIEQKNKEIVKLRMDNDELRTGHEQAPGQKIASRIQIMDEIEDFLQNVNVELEKTKHNLYNSEGQQPLTQPPYADQKGYKKYQTEDSLLTALFDKIQVMHNLMALASEVYILSTQNMYARANHNFQPQQTQLGMVKVPEAEYKKMVQENAHLERLINQYEQAIAKFEFVSQNPDDQKGLIEIQCLSQSQLQQIAQLQHEVSQLQQELGNNQNFGVQHNQITMLTQENRALKQDIQLLRECELRSQNLQNGNEELMGERQQLLVKIDQFEQIQSQINLQLQDSQLQVADRDTQLEELRKRITQIAELFEKKPIKQRYSFEVLCDFVSDKAKRLFTKYEAAVQDKKQIQQDDKNNRVIYKLEQEISNLTDISNVVKNYAAPIMMGLLQREWNKDSAQQLNNIFLRELFKDVEYEYKKLEKEVSDNGQTIKSNLRQIESLQKAQNQSPNENRHPNNHYNAGYSPNGRPSHQQTTLMNTQNNSQNEDQIKTMQQEKNQLHSKIDEFSQVLKEFQVNQRQFEMENQQLKTKIQQLENNGSKPEPTDRYSQHVSQSLNMVTSLGTPNDLQRQTLQGSQLNSQNQNHRRNEPTNFHMVTNSSNQNFNQTSYSGIAQSAATGGYVGGVIQQQVSPSPLKVHQNI